MSEIRETLVTAECHEVKVISSLLIPNEALGHD